MIFGCFHSRDSQLHNKCSFCSIIFISKIPLFGGLCSKIHRKGRSRQRWQIPNSFHNVHRNMSKVFYNQILRLFWKYIIDNISTANVFHSRRGKSNTYPNSVAWVKLMWPLDAMLSFWLIFLNKSLKLCLKTVDTLRKR